MNRYDWLLFLHVTGAFMVLGGVAMAGIFNVTAMRRGRPSEVALLFRLTQVAAGLITAGMLVTLAIGLWLVSDADYGYGETWVVLALILWVLANALGGIGGNREKETRRLAERLAAEGDAPSDELRARLRDPVSLALSWGSGVVVIVILVLMIWEAWRLMLAAVRPDSVNFPLFLHVLGAATLVGAVAATTILAASSQRWPWLRRVAFRTLLLVVVPAWLLMRLGGLWTDSKEDIPGDPTWLALGNIVGDLGLIILIATTLVGWWSMRRPETRWPGQTVAALSGVYLIALLVAMFAMSGKPGS